MDRKPAVGGAAATAAANKGIKIEDEKRNEGSSADARTRVLVGVMRVGLLAKQLLLK